MVSSLDTFTTFWSICIRYKVDDDCWKRQTFYSIFGRRLIRHRPTPHATPMLRRSEDIIGDVAIRLVDIKITKKQSIYPCNCHTIFALRTYDYCKRQNCGRAWGSCQERQNHCGQFLGAMVWTMRTNECHFRKTGVVTSGVDIHQRKGVESLIVFIDRSHVSVFIQM